MIAGPQDYSETHELWPARAGRTATNKYSALLHVRDYIGFDRQKSVFDQLTNRNASADQLHAEASEVRDPHNAILRNAELFREKWMRLLRRFAE